MQSYDAPSSGYDKPPKPSGKPSITYTINCLRRGLDLGWARTNPCFNIQDMVSGLMNTGAVKDSLLIGVSNIVTKIFSKDTSFSTELMNLTFEFLFLC